MKYLKLSLFVLIVFLFISTSCNRRGVSLSNPQADSISNQELLNRLNELYEIIGQTENGDAKGSEKEEPSESSKEVPMPSSVVSYAGKQRLKITWNVNPDSVNHTIIFWDGITGTKAIQVTVEPGNKEKVVSQIIDLPEGTYDFRLYNYNSNGDVSVPAKITGNSYGLVYRQSNAKNRDVQTIKIKDDKATIVWGDELNKDAVAIVIQYFNNNKLLNTDTVLPRKDETEISDIDLNSTLKYLTVYKPTETAIDTFCSSYKEFSDISIFDRAYYLSFSTLQRGGDSEPFPLTVWISEDFDGIYKPDHLDDATWVDITSEFDWSPFAPSGNPYTETIHNISSYLSKMRNFYVAFKYHYIPNETPSGRNWFLKDFQVFSPTKNDILEDDPMSTFFHLILEGGWDKPDRVIFYGPPKNYILFRDNWADKNVELTAWIISKEIELE